MKKGFTFSELLVSMLIIAITFQIVYYIVDNSVESYKNSRINLQNLYAESSISLLFDILENELKYAGSGGELLKELHKPVFDPGNQGSYEQVGEVYSQVTDHCKIANSIDYYEDSQKKEFYITYVVTYKNFFVRNGDGTYSPLYGGDLGKINWVIIKNKLSSSADGYYTRIAKLDADKISGPGTYPGEITPSDIFEFKEINLAKTNKTLSLRNEDKYVYPLYEKSVAFTGYPSVMIKQTKIVFEKESGKIYIERYFPIPDSTSNIYISNILENVEDFDINAMYYSNGIKEKPLSEVDSSFDLSSIFALKFVLTWNAPWKYKSKEFKIIKERIIVLIPNL
jgi:prepilin-type N-terminal cleavage/methylation domain-containing protein